MPKITILGAGSAFTSGLTRDVMLIPGIKGGEIALVDIDAKRLATTLKLIKALVKMVNEKFNLRWTVSASVDRRKVLKGTDYVINCIEVSGVSCVRHDNDIPLKYGIDQCIGDTIGPGGIFKALRTVPSWYAILADIEKLCPNALICNYTNPMSIMTLAAARSSSAQVVGLCHSVQGATHQMAALAGVPIEKMAFKCGGVNHLAWLTELKYRNRDLYPKIIRRGKTEKDVYESDPVRFEILFHFGAFVTESSGHMSEYVPYFRKRKDTLKRYCRDGYRGGSGFYSKCWPTWRKMSDKQREKLARDVSGIPMERGYEYASEIIEAHLFNRPKVIYGSVLNEGLISNLASNGVVEVAVLVDNTGFRPCKFGRLPTQMAALCASHMSVYDLVVTGIAEKDRDAIYHAMLLDPLNAAVCSPAEIIRMTDEMATAEKKYIPAFMTRGPKRVRQARARKPQIGAK